jgi:alkylation response protein AidB-like acyl-CoA dehydrogenase
MGMAGKYFSNRTLRFLLYEVFDVESLTEYPYFEEHSRDSFDLVTDTAFKMAQTLLRPYFEEMDRTPPRLENGRIKVHPAVRTFLAACGEGGWIAAGSPFDTGGQQLPQMITSTCSFIWAAANYSASVYPMLISGAAQLINSFGSHELKATYIPRMFVGEWQGTMALTEPQAGSSLADITTTSEPTGEGHYRIRGQKIFISASDHDGVENIVHLLLAKIKGGPPGIKGISLFVVPRERLGESGELVSNDVNVAGIFHKLGYRGCPIAQLNFGENEDCRGWIVGEPHKGISYMFQMMNHARIEVGIGATAIASAAFHASLEYTQARPQGRRPSDKAPTSQPIMIIDHPDVRRMLLFQRSVVEGSLSLLLQCAKYYDMRRCPNEDIRQRSSLLLELLTPVAKSYPSEMGILSVSAALQCLGGYGYCDEFPIEQHYRDMRIHAIHEGTTGIHGLDLLGRKVIMAEGKAFRYFLEEIESTIKASAKFPVSREYGKRLSETVSTLHRVTGHLVGIASKGDIERYLADATLYLEFFGIVALAWQWLKQGTIAEKTLSHSQPTTDSDFYQAKILTMKYFFHYELPKILGLEKRLMESDGLTIQPIILESL